VDWGFVNPTAVVVVVKDPWHNRVIVERVYYASGIRASRWAQLLLERLPQLVAAPVMDHDSFARAECEAEGLPSSAARKDVLPGIEAVERQLQEQGDGRPGLVLAIDPTLLDPVLGRCDSDKLAWELEGYHYRAKREGSPDVKDEPIKKDDHGADALRYVVVDHCRGLSGPAMPANVRANRASVFCDEDDEEDTVSLIERLRGGW
jgi:phage terminase large subunit